MMSETGCFWGDGMESSAGCHDEMLAVAEAEALIQGSA